MRIAAAILAAGSSERFGQDKTLLPLEGKPVWKHSFDRFKANPQVDEVFVICSEANQSAIQNMVPDDVNVIRGGRTRQASSVTAVEFALLQGCDVVLLHDAARPFVSAEIIDRVIEQTKLGRSCAPGIRVTDTIKEIRSEQSVVTTHERSRLRAMQTPQGVNAKDYLAALNDSGAQGTDDLAVLEAAGYETYVLEGDPENFKITTQPDYERAVRLATTDLAQPLQTRTGLGYDIHRFSTEPDRPLWLGGLHFPNVIGLEGHSDADVILHAVTDALLGSLALGDIGQHFPNNDPGWRNHPSINFLAHAAKLVYEKGWRIQNIDIAVQAEFPKIMPRATEIRITIAGAIGLTPDQVSIKATTNEGLGSIGRGKGIAAFAIVTIQNH